MLKLVLSNEMEIEINDGSTLFDIIVHHEKYSDLWDQLTSENLKKVMIVTEDGDLVEQMDDLVMENEMSFRHKGNIVCHFYLREKMEVELLREQVADLTAQLNVHDGAIADMGETISGLAEEGGLA